MITYVKGIISDSPPQVLINIVNTVGVMGKAMRWSLRTGYAHIHRLY